MTDEDRALAAVRELGGVADRDAADDPELLARVQQRLTTDVAAAARVPLRRRARRWRWPLVAVVAVALTAGAATAAQTVLDESESGPAREEITSYMDDAGISATTARSRFAEQRRLSLAEPALTAAAGRWYGGMWIENDDDDRMKIALVDGAPDEIRERVVAVLSEHDLAARADVVTTPRSQSDLLALQARIDAELVEVNRGVEIYVNVEPDVKRGRLILTRPVPHSATTARQRAYLERAPERYGDVLVVRDGPGKLCIGVAGDPPCR